jgi:hypothetical protein
MKMEKKETKQKKMPNGQVASPEQLLPQPQLTKSLATLPLCSRGAHYQSAGFKILGYFGFRTCSDSAASYQSMSAHTTVLHSLAPPPGATSPLLPALPITSKVFAICILAVQESQYCCVSSPEHPTT